MPVSVPTTDDLQALADQVADLQHQVADLDAEVSDLESRVAALESGEGPTPPDPPDPPDPPPSTETVTIRMAGAEYLYDPAEGLDIGDYHDPAGRFVMSCIRVKRPDCRLVVDFRATDKWSCIVFENSDPLNNDQPVLSYEAHIGDAAPIVIAGHMGNTAWRQQSCPWPHPITDIEDLYAKKLLPRFDGAMACGKAGNTPTVTSAPPLSLCGFTGAMGATGGRADIGTVTGWQGEYLCLKGADMLKTVLVQGEAAFPWRFRDTQSGAMLDVIKKYPQASQHWGNGPSGNPQIWQSPNTGVSCDTAHSPAAYYLPFLLTGDPYFLENQQGECAYHFVEIPRNPNTVVGSEQVRGIAWSLRTLMNTADATPDAVPSWLLPKQIFADELSRQLGLLKARQGDGWVYRNFSHIIDSYGRWQHAWWQHDYATAIAAWASLLRPEWAEQRDYMVAGIAGRNDPDSGWCSGYPTNYWTNTTNKNDYYPDGSFKTWLEAWSYNSQYVYTDTPGGYCCTLEEHLSKNTSYDYMSGMVHALRLSAQAGCAQAGEVMASIEGPWEAGLRSSAGFTEYKYCAAPQ